MGLVESNRHYSSGRWEPQGRHNRLIPSSKQQGSGQLSLHRSSMGHSLHSNLHRGRNFGQSLQHSILEAILSSIQVVDRQVSISREQILHLGLQHLRLLSGRLNLGQLE